MGGAQISTVGRQARKVWYKLWELIENRFYRDRDYTIQVPTGYRVYTPWFNANNGSSFAAALKTATCGGQFSMAQDRAFILHQFVLRSARLPGSMAECGVYKGTSAHFVAASLPHPVDFHLFDTFAGLPDFAVPERDYHKPGSYSDTSLVAVQERLRAYPFCQFHPGIIPDTFAEVADVPAYSLVNMDVSMYPTTQAGCEWFWPRMVPGGVIIFNDYGMYPYRYSTRRAADEFFASQGEPLVVLPTGQALAIKAPA